MEEVHIDILDKARSCDGGGGAYLHGPEARAKDLIGSIQTYENPGYDS